MARNHRKEKKGGVFLGKRLAFQGIKAINELLLALLHLQDEVDVARRQLGALRVPRELECLRRHVLRAVFQERNEQVNCIVRWGLTSFKYSFFMNIKKFKTVGSLNWIKKIHLDIYERKNGREFMNTGWYHSGIE